MLLTVLNTHTFDTISNFSLKLMAKLLQKLEQAASKLIFLKNISPPSYVEIANALEIQKMLKIDGNVSVRRSSSCKSYFDK